MKDYSIANEYPDIDEALVKHLEAAFPPKCYEGVGSLEAHLVYAGKVQLVQTLRDILTAQKTQEADDGLLSMEIEIKQTGD